MQPMLDIIRVEPLPEQHLRLTLSNGQVVERDISDLLRGPVFERVAGSEEAFNEVVCEWGTAAWPLDGADIAPETLIWNGPYPPDDTDLVPPDFAVVVSPNRPPR
jgi:hypothetical protein